MTTEIHPTAIIESGSQLDFGVRVGAYAYVGGGVRIGSGTVVWHHATVDGATTLGADNEVHPYAYIGAKTHDLKFRGGIPGLIVGSRNVFREFSTVHCATDDGQFTRLGDDNVILAYSHIAHDCQIGNHFVMSSHAALAGHVHVGNYVNFGWGAGIHQFCKIGDYAMVAGMARVSQDVPPFMIVEGAPAVSRTINKVGLERRGFTPEDLQVARRIYKLYFKQGLNRTQATEALRSDPAAEHRLGRLMLEFVARSERGLA